MLHGPADILQTLVIGFVVVVPFIVVGVSVLTGRRRKNAMRSAMQSTDACLACGSKEVLVAAGKRLCLRCRYEGDADGGGVLTQAELDAAFPEPEHEPDRTFDNNF